MNGEYIKAMDFDKFYEMAEPYIKKVITKDLDLKKIAAMVKTRIEIFPDIEGHIDFFETLPEYDPQMYVHKKMKTNLETSLKGIKRCSADSGSTGRFLQRRSVRGAVKYVSKRALRPAL